MTLSLLLKLALVIQILSAIAMIAVILVQHGQGADMGAAFGSGGSGSLFGASGGASFLSHTTAALVTVFLGSTLFLAYYGFSVPRAAPGGGSVLERAPITAPAGEAEQPPLAPGGIEDEIPADDAGSAAASVPEVESEPGGSVPEDSDATLIPGQ